MQKKGELQKNRQQNNRFFSPSAFILFIYLFKQFLLAYSCFTLLCQFLCYSKVNWLYIYIHPLFWISFLFRLPPSIQQHSCAVQQVVINLIVYIYVNPNLLIHPTTIPLSPWYPYVCSLHLCTSFKGVLLSGLLFK